MNAPINRRATHRRALARKTPHLWVSRPERGVTSHVTDHGCPQYTKVGLPRTIATQAGN